MFVAVSSLKEDNAKLIGKAEILESYDEQDLKQKLSLVLSAVPGNKGLPGLFSTVEKVAKTAGVTLLNMSVTGGTIASISAQKQSAAEQKVGSRTIPFMVTVVGTSASMQKFITLAPRVRRLMRIRSFSTLFSKNDVPITVTLSMNAFYEPFVTSLGGASSVLTALSASELALIEQLSIFPLVGHEVQTIPMTAVTEQRLILFLVNKIRSF